MGPACTCYDSNYEKELKSCRSKCPTDEGEIEATSPEEEGLCFGSAGRDTCRADQLGGTSERFLLYDVKPGEGFNLQREVFPRVGWIVSQLNAAAQQQCGSARTCPRWSLVLPPWCRLAHWRQSSQEPVPWERFFDATALRSPNISVMEPAAKRPKGIVRKDGDEFSGATAPFVQWAKSRTGHREFD
ncbi:GDP-fucose protein O-fucosyltransferase 2 (Peptide-O-fucosyltransferase 2) (O-FucT-2) [Durusdinium trenchii]|uniref:GDP-fucose protein O-fucosyltransferase 2 (Peptide-O-fucosyltransferase 2) (O-FucT-2) n=1 Tax=Durusdinium trenchii TaxID=1381693 RepID=A0ABP0L7W2_9DINO